MFDKALGLIAPHHCKKCQKEGQSLCNSCKKDIIKVHKTRIEKCIVCQKPSPAGICWHRGFNFDQVYYLDFRQGVLKDLINEYKFNLHRDLAVSLAEIIAPLLPDDSTIQLVPMPTIAQHKRERGFDHISLIAKHLAKIKGYHYKPVLRRLTHQSQQQLSRMDRLANAKMAFGCDQQLDPKAKYLLLDDIWTTGASCRYAVNVLRQAGAKDVSVAIFLRQPVTDSSQKSAKMIK